MLDWNDYRYFLAVARGGSLSAAARSLGVDQSTVGRRLATLQDACGARLFDQTPTGYILTAAGESVHEDVARLEEGFLAVERRLAGTDAKPEGVVRIATTETFAAFLVERIPPLRARYPALSLELVTSDTVVDLSRRAADVAVRIGAPPKQPNLIVRKLGVVGFGLFGSARYLARRPRPRLRDGLAGHEVVAFGGQLARAPLGRWLDTYAAAARVALRADSLEVAHKAVVAGLGLGVLPAMFASGAPSQLERIPADVPTSSPIIIVVHEDQARSARVRVVIDHIASAIHRDRALLVGKR